MIPKETLDWAQDIRKILGTDPDVAEADLEEIISKVSVGDADAIGIDMGAFFRLLDARQFSLREISDRKIIVQKMYDELNHRYSFLEALASGNYAPWPHELTAVTCSSQMFVNYIVARDWKELDPRIYEFRNFGKLDSGFNADHSFITVDVGDAQRWVLDQSMRILGPVRWKDSAMIVQNHARGNQLEEYQFLDSIEFDEQSYLIRLAYQRSTEGAASMLISGQRIAVSETDNWKSGNRRLHTESYVRFDAQDRSLVTMVGVQRPVVQNRGIENKTTLDDKGAVLSDTITGYFFDQIQWANFHDRYPVVSLAVNELVPLIKGINKFSYEEQVAFEERMMRIARKDIGSDSDKAYASAMERSYHAISNTNFGKALKKFALYEALYQDARQGRDYVFDQKRRERELGNMAQTDENINAIVKAKKLLSTAKRARELIESRTYHKRRMRLLDPKRVEDEATQQYLQIQQGIEQLEYLLSGKPQFFDEAVDRLTFSRTALRKVQSADELEEYGAKVFSDTLEERRMIGYARIFAEFLGHISNSWDLLRIEKSRSDVYKKMIAYRA